MKFLIFILVFFSSCGENRDNVKEIRKDYLIEESIENDLNTQNYDEALKKIHFVKEKLERDGKRNERIEFLEATIYASKANINIYTLYPLLELHLFNTAAINWDEIGQRRNPYSEYVDKYFQTDDDDSEKGEEEGEAAQHKKKRNILNLMNFIWSMYETIPHVELIPEIKSFDEPNALKSISILNSLLSSPEYRRRGYLYRSLIASLIFMNNAKKIFHVTGGDPVTFFCNARLSRLFEKSEIINDMLYYFVEGLEKTTNNKDKTVKFQAYLLKLQSMPTSFSVGYNYKKVEKVQDDYCEKILNF